MADKANLDLAGDVVDLTEALMNIESVSHHEQSIADAVEAQLRTYAHLTVTREGHNLVARTDFGRDERVVIAGHLDTVPLNDNLPARRDDEFLYGLGACDMKGGVAVILHLAATLDEPVRDITYVLYEAEEVAEEFNGLKKLAETSPEVLQADFAILMEPSNAGVEAGCQGTMRIEVRTKGERSHSARSWMGHNAIHEAHDILATLNAYEPRRPVISGLEYREGLNAVWISGGVAGNVVPDECVVTINYRFAPDRSLEEAETHLRQLFGAYDITVTDRSPGALPGLERPAAAQFIKSVGGEVNPKFGWTDVSRFSGVGVPAVNYGPGDPLYAHKQDEFVPVAEIRQCADRLRAWLIEEGTE